MASSAVALHRPNAISSSGNVYWKNPKWDSSTSTWKVNGPSGFSSASAVGVSANDGLSSYMQMIRDMNQVNNRWSALQADKMNKFNAEQAALSRKWQEYMSNTAHQREIKDLKAAGLNPVLSAMGGSGAPVTSGATASGGMGSTDTSGPGALVSLLGSVLSAQTAQANAALSAQTNIAVAEKYTAMQKYVSEVQSKTQLTTANISAMASKFAATIHADATKVAASISAAAQRYGYDVMSMTNKQIAAFNGQVNKDLKQMGIDSNFDLKEQYPDSLWNLLSQVLTGTTDTSSAKDFARNGLLGNIWDFLTKSPSQRFNGAGGRR